MVSPFDLRWGILGVRFCIQPSFWIMNALWAYLMYAYPHVQRNPNDLPSPFTGEFLEIALIWILCMLVSILVHELGHVIAGRIFGQAGNITVGGMGGLAAGEYGDLKVWQRILVIAAGPCAGFLFVALIVLFDADTSKWNMIIGGQWPSLRLNWYGVDWIDPLLRMGLSRRYDNVVFLLVIVNLFLNILNLLPIIPMDGGMIFKEICCVIAPKAGLKFAFIWSFALAIAVTLYFLVVVLVERRVIAKPFELYYPFAFPEFSLVIFAMLAYQSFQAYRQIVAMERHAMYRED